LHDGYGRPPSRAPELARDPADVFYVKGMKLKPTGINYQVMFWAATGIGMASLLVSLTGRSAEDPRFSDPHLLSELRGPSYPFTIEVNGYKYEGKTGDYVYDTILAYGAYEKDVLFFLRDYVSARGNQEAVFLDVGACEGQHSLFLSRLVRQVHAFEPYPPAVARFKREVALNGFSNITLHEVGLGASEGMVPFYAPPAENIGSGTFFAEHNQGAERPVGRFRVVVGDEWLGPLALPGVDVVKIDVEGFEKPVLQGLNRTLQRHRPILVIEVAQRPRGTIESIAELRGLLPPDYRLLRFRSSREDVITGNYHLEPISSIGQGDSYEMVVAYPQERESLVRCAPAKAPASAVPYAGRDVSGSAESQLARNR
jgi:FkbM family methyltransferase